MILRAKIQLCQNDVALTPSNDRLEKAVPLARFARMPSLLSLIRYTNMEKPCQLLSLTVFLMPVPVFAEVMDKEMSVPQIWQALGWALLVALIAATIWRWLLVTSFFLGPSAALGFTWTEWFNSSVGRAMRAEAGEIYGVHINSALSLLFIAHIVLWLVSTRVSLVCFFRPAQTAPEKQTRRTLGFAITLWALALLDTLGGFGATAWIWLSPPFLIVTLFLFMAVIFYLRTVTRLVAVA